MKKSALAVSFFAFAAVVAHADEAHCSLATLKGTLAWSSTTQHVNGTPTDGSGFEYYDGHGHMKYFEQYSDGTSSQTFGGVGTYTISANCIATVVYDGVQTWTYFIAPDGGHYYYSNSLGTGGISAGRADKVSDSDLIP